VSVWMMWMKKGIFSKHHQKSDYLYITESTESSSTTSTSDNVGQTVGIMTTTRTGLVVLISGCVCSAPRGSQRTEKLTAGQHIASPRQIRRRSSESWSSSSSAWKNLLLIYLATAADSQPVAATFVWRTASSDGEEDPPHVCV
jgi:hypothetical protein